MLSGHHHALAHGSNVFQTTAGQHVHTSAHIVLTHRLRQHLTCSYYHRTTFLQLNTITFLLPFPNVFFPSELSGSRRNDSNSMSTFLFENILPINRCSRLHPFCNLPNCCIRSPIMFSDFPKPRKFGTNRDATKTRRVLWAEIEILVALLFHPCGSLNTGNFVLISFGTCI